MKRLLWLGVGLAVGAIAVRVVTKKAQSYTPRGIAAAAADSGRNLVDSVRSFVDDVRDGMHEREQELRAAFVDGVPLDDDLDGVLNGDDFDEVFGEPDQRLGGAPPGEPAPDRPAGRAPDSVNPPEDNHR